MWAASSNDVICWLACGLASLDDDGNKAAARPRRLAVFRVEADSPDWRGPRGGAGTVFSLAGRG